MKRINGAKARELLAPIADKDAVFATPPWDEWVTEGADNARMSVVDVRCDVVADVYEPDALPLIAGAPALAETVTWLYGANSHPGDFGFQRWPLGGSWSVGLRDGHISIGPEGGGLGFRTPEDAEEAARALLAAAEEARA